MVAVTAAAVRRGRNHPSEFKRKVSPSERSLITLKAFLPGYSLWLTADKCDFAMTDLVEMVHGQFGAIHVVNPDVVEAAGWAREGDRRQSVHNKAEGLPPELVTAEGGADQNAGRRKCAHHLQQARFPVTILGGIS